LNISAPHFVRTEAISKKAIDEKSNSSSTILQLSRKQAYSFSSHRQEKTKYARLRSGQDPLIHAIVGAVTTRVRPRFQKDIPIHPIPT
jgi:hypothetical protein